MFQTIGSLIFDLITLVGIVFIVSVLINTPVKKPYIKWKWIGIGLMLVGVLLNLFDKLI